MWPDHFTPQIDSFFLSYVKECMTNAVKHGRASEIHVICSRDKENITSMTIHNNAQVMTGDITYGVGLKGIQETLEAMGGCLKIKSSENAFAVTACLFYNGI